MKVCIHRGTKEIGGTCIEIESCGKHLVLDIGLPLDVDPELVSVPPVNGFMRDDDSLLGVFVSHSHLDHYGLVEKLRFTIPILIGSAAERILKAASLFVPGGVRIRNPVHIAHLKIVELGPFTLTPYLVDHSAYDAYALLVEADGERLFYTGDIRGHGRKRKLFEEFLKHPPRGVDILFLEGTTIGRSDARGSMSTETDLEKRFVDLFSKTRGMPLVWCSGQNIDRLVTIFRACKRAGRNLIVDMYTAHILRATGNHSIPQAEWPNVKVFLPTGQKNAIVRKKAFDVSESYKHSRIYPEALAEYAPESVMLFRPSMIQDLEEADCLEGSQLIYSMWSGYLEQENNAEFLNWLDDRGIPLHQCHTSGHAGITDLQKLAKALTPKILVPIHSFETGRFHDFFDNVEQKQDGQWWEVARDE